MVRGLPNTSELGLACSCSLTSPSAVSESYLSVSDAQLLRLLALGVTGVVGLVGCFGRVVCMWVAELAWFESVILSSPALFYDCLVVVYWGATVCTECISHASSIHPCEAP